MSNKANKYSFWGDQLNDLPTLGLMDRNKSFHLFEKAGVPHSKMEKWQKSKIKKALNNEFSLAKDQGSLNNGSKEGFSFDTLASCHFIDGFFQGDQRLIDSSNGLIFGSLAEAMKVHPALVEKHLNRYVDEELNGLNALNSAIFQDGFFLFVPKNLVLDLPLALIEESMDSNANLSQMRNLVIIESGASVSIVHRDLRGENTQSFSNGVSEVFIGANASLKWYRDQDLGVNDAMVNSVFCYQERDSRSRFINASLHGSMIRNDVRIKMDGEGCEADVFGVYLPQTGEQVDNQVFVEHAKPNCVSNELFKGVLDGEGASIFNGHILVKEDAQKTNAYQTNRSILLSDDADAFAKPFLEIYADDVRCSHGATVGQLDEKALFYLRSRGLAEETARGFLIRAFLGEVLEHCDHDDFRKEIEAKIDKKLNS